MKREGVRQFLTESLWVATGQVLAATGSIVGVKLLTEAMAPATYGVLSLAVTTATLLHSVFWGALASAGQRYYSTSLEHGRLQAFLRALEQLSHNSTWILILCTLPFLAIFSLSERHSISLLTFFTVLFTVFYGYSYVIDGLQNAARNRALVSMHSGALSWCRFLLAYTFVLLSGDSAWLAMAGFAAAALLILLSEHHFYRTRIVPASITHDVSFQAIEDIRQTIVGYAWPIAAVGGMIWVQQSADRWALQIFCSSTEVGLYSALFQIGYTPVVMVFVFLFQTLSPFVFSRAGSGSDQCRLKHADRLNCQMAAVFSLMVLLVFSGVLIFGDNLSFLVGERYRVVFGLLPMMVLAGGIFSVAQTFYGYFMIRGETRQLLVPTIVFSIVGTVVVFLAAKFYGVNGVVIARVMTSLLYLVFVLLLISRYGKKKSLEQSIPV